MDRKTTANSKRQIGMGAMLSYVSIAVNILAGLLYTPWMVRTIGQSDYSLFTLANSLITLFLVDFGLSSATARFVSMYRAEQNQEKINNFLGAIYKLYLIVDLILFVILTIVFFSLEKIYVSLSVEELEKLKVVYVIAASYSLISFPFVTLNGILTAYEKFIQIKLGDLLYRFLIVGLMIIALSNGFGLYAIVMVNAFAGITIIVYKLFVIHRNTDIKINFLYKDNALFKSIFGFSIWVTVNTLAQRLIFNITPTILGIVYNSSSIAVFGIVTTIEGYAYTLTSAINGMFMPKISQLNFEENSEKKLTDLMISVGRFQFALNGLIVAGFVVVGGKFINLWMGNDYILAYPGIILVLVPGLFFNSLQIANTTLIVQGKVKLQAIIGVIVGITNIAISIVLSRFFGTIGACASICIAYFLRTILFIIVDKRKLHFDMRKFILRCYVQMFPPVLITILFGILLNNIIKVNGWIVLALQIIILTVIYLMSVLFISFNKNERLHIKKIVLSLYKKI